MEKTSARERGRETYRRPAGADKIAARYVAAESARVDAAA
jgi:hypothetical protein